MVARYEQQADGLFIGRIIVDREGMAAEFLATLRAAGRVVSVLRADQYDGLESFRDVGNFATLVISKQGNVVREVAPASIALPLPDHPGESLLLRVALIHYLRCHIPVAPRSEDREYPKQWDTGLDWPDRSWWRDG